MEETDFSSVHELRGAMELRRGATGEPPRRATGEPPRRATGEPTQNDRLFRLAVLTLGLLCVLQGALNICLRLSFPSDQEQTELFGSNASLLDSCVNVSSCRVLLRKVLQENLRLTEQRDQLLLDMGGDDKGSGSEDY